MVWSVCSTTTTTRAITFLAGSCLFFHSLGLSLHVKHLENCHIDGSEV
jgi:hypothetical protein